MVDQLPNRLTDDLDRRLDEFDASWNDGPPPDLEQFIPTALRSSEIPKRPQWRRYVAELLTIDLEYRVRLATGATSPRVEDYFDRVPWLPQDQLVLMELIPAEYMARHTYGDRPGVGEYQLRFPHLGEAIAAALDDAQTDLVLEDSGTAPRGSDDLTDSFSAVQVTVTDGAADSTAVVGDSVAPTDQGVKRTFGNYELQSEIARGGMGIVYKAVQRSLKRTVALKVILAGQFAQSEDVRRFHAEAEAAAKLDHPNIVPIYEVGRVEGNHFFSMAYVDGPSLSVEVAEQPLDGARAALVIRDVADAIEYAHQQGVIHRDLKPANILLERGRTPRITDFGLARQTSVESGMTVTGQILGTPSYMPPEQALGQIVRIDARSDVYSLGATLYCLLTGRGPFQAAGVVQTLAQVVQEEPVPPRRLNSDVPRDLENICLKCLAKSPDARYQTAAELRDDLNRFLGGKPTIARPLSSTERVLRFCRRNPGTSSLIAISSLLVIALAAVSTAAYFQTRDAFNTSEGQRIEIARKEQEAQREKQNAIAAEQQAVRLRQDAEAARDRADTQAQVAKAAEERERATRIEFESALRLAEFNIYLNTLQRTQQLWNEGQVEQARQLHDRLPKELKLWDELHGWEWDHVSRRLHQEQRLINAHDQPVLSASWSPDGQLFASAGQDRTIKLWNTQTGRLYAPPLTGHQDWVWTVQFVDEGRQLLSISIDGGIRLWSVEKGVLVDVIIDAGDPIAVASIAADGRRWAQADGRGTVTVWDLASRSRVAEWHQSGSRTTALVLDADGGDIAIGRTITNDEGTTHQISIRPVAEDGDGVTLTNEAAVLALAFSADGERLAAGGSSDQVQVWDTTTGRRIGRWTAHRGSIYGVQFAEDGDQLLTCSADQTISLWSVRNESVLETLRGHRGPVFAAQLRPGGSEILSAGDDGTVRLWQPGRDQFTLPSLSSANVVFLSADGTGLVYLSDDGLRELPFGESREPRTIPLAIDSAVDNAVPLARGAGTYAVAVGVDTFVDNSVGDQPAQLPAAGDHVTRLCASGDGSQLAIADASGLLRLFDVATSAQRWEHRFATRVAVVTFCDDDRQLLAVDLDGAAVLVDAQTGEPRQQSQLIDGARSISTSPTEPVVAIGGIDGLIHLYNFRELTPVTVLRGHQGAVTAVQFSPDGGRLASAGSDRTVRIWAPEVRDWGADQEALLLTLQGHDRGVEHVFWMTTDDSLLSIDRAGTAIRWRTRRR